MDERARQEEPERELEQELRQEPVTCLCCKEHNKFRELCIELVDSETFDRFIFSCIVIGAVFLAAEGPPVIKGPSGGDMFTAAAADLGGAGNETTLDVNVGVGRHRHSAPAAPAAPAALAPSRRPPRDCTERACPAVARNNKPSSGLNAEMGRRECPPALHSPLCPNKAVHGRTRAWRSKCVSRTSARICY